MSPSSPFPPIAALPSASCAPAPRDLPRPPPPLLSLLLQLVKAVLGLGDVTYPMAARKQRIVLRVLQDITGARWTYRTEQYSTPSSLPQVTVNASAVPEEEAAAAMAAEGEP